MGRAKNGAAMRRLLWILLGGLAAACGAPDDGSTSIAAMPRGPDLIFEREGVPGPWWRRGATADQFETEHRACLSQSRAARAGAEDPADAAYRTFLACMEHTRWRRGPPPLAPPRNGSSPPT